MDLTGLEFRRLPALWFRGEGFCTVTFQLFPPRSTSGCAFSSLSTNKWCSQSQLCSRAIWVTSLHNPRPSLAPTLRHPTFITASVCSSSQPTKAWPDSWNATTFCSSFERILLFLAVPERMPRILSLGPRIILCKHAETFLARPYRLCTMLLWDPHGSVTFCVSAPADPIRNYHSNLKGNSLGMRGAGGGHLYSHFHKCWNNSNSSCRLPGWSCRADRISMGSTANSRFAGFTPRASRDNCSLCDSTVLSPLVADYLLSWYLYISPVQIITNISFTNFPNILKFPFDASSRFRVFIISCY